MKRITALLLSVALIVSLILAGFGMTRVESSMTPSQTDLRTRVARVLTRVESPMIPNRTTDRAMTDRHEDQHYAYVEPTPDQKLAYTDADMELLWAMIIESQQMTQEEELPMKKVLAIVDRHHILSSQVPEEEPMIDTLADNEADEALKLLNRLGIVTDEELAKPDEVVFVDDLAKMLGRAFSEEAEILARQTAPAAVRVDYKLAVEILYEVFTMNQGDLSKEPEDALVWASERGDFMSYWQNGKITRENFAEFFLVTCELS